MVRAARAYVPVIIRRPHAYDFLRNAFGDRVDGSGNGSADVRASASGIQVGELELPIPGFYVLDAQGRVLEKTGLASVEDVLALLRAHAGR